MRQTNMQEKFKYTFKISIQIGNNNIAIKIFIMEGLVN